MMELKEIQDLIKFVAKSGVSEVELESKGFKLVIRTTHPSGMGDAPVMQQHVPTIIHAPVAAPAVAQAPVAAPTTAPPKVESASASDESKYMTVRAPMIGTFYRSGGPDKPTFVNVGDEIKPGKVLCIIEAMKLFNEIESELSGKIVKVLVDDSTPVEYDQPLFLVDPA
jgi:acetyl-CoA carboxylase biotin carboxyl carrier protein